MKDATSATVLTAVPNATVVDELDVMIVQIHTQKCSILTKKNFHAWIAHLMQNVSASIANCNDIVAIWANVYALAVQ